MNIFNLILIIFSCLYNVTAAVYDKALSTSTQALLKDDSLFFSFRNIQPPRRPTNYAHQVLISLALPEHNRLALILDRNRGQFVIETTISGDVDRKVIDGKDIRLHSKIDSVLVELIQSKRAITVYVNCRLIGKSTVAMSPRDMDANLSELRVYHGRNVDVSVDSKSDIYDLLEKLDCDNLNNVEYQAQANEIYTYRRGDIPILHEDEKASVLVKSLSQLSETIRELQVEIQTQREETALLRDAIINCEACKPGRGHNFS